MKVLGLVARRLVGIPAFAVVLLALSACGPRVTSGDENTVLITSGPFTSLSDTQSFAQEYCAQFGKSASVQGSSPDPATLQDTYRFNCEEDPL